MDNKAVGLKIKEYRKKKKLTQKELAELINRTESSIRKYEKGLIEIPNSILEKIAQALEINITDLINITMLSSNVIPPKDNLCFINPSKPKIPGEISLKITKENFDKYKQIFLLASYQMCEEVYEKEPMVAKIYDAKTGKEIVGTMIDFLEKLDDEHKFLFLLETVDEIRYNPILDIFSIVAKPSTFDKKGEN